MFCVVSRRKSTHLVDVRIAKFSFDMFRPTPMGLLQDWNCNDQISGAKWRWWPGRSDVCRKAVHTSTPPAKITARHFQIHNRTLQVESQNVKKKLHLESWWLFSQDFPTAPQPHQLSSRIKQNKRITKKYPQYTYDSYDMIMSYRPHPTTTAAASAHSAHCDFRAPTRSAAVLTPARRGAARGGTRRPRWRQWSGRPPMSFDVGFCNSEAMRT